MRNHSYLTLAAASLMAGVAAVSCSDDKTEPLPALTEKTYTSTSLSLSYSGEAMPGKSVTFIPDASDASKGTLRLYAALDLASLGIEGLTGTLPAAGVIPGSPVLELPVELSPGDGCYTFSGIGATPACSYSYTGRITDSGMTLAFNDVRLADTSLAGTVLVPTPLKGSELEGYTSSPVYAVWEIDPALGLDIDLSMLLQAAATMPVIPVYGGTAYTSIAQLVDSSLQTVALRADGDIVLRYFASSDGTTQLFTSNGNTFQYVPASAGSMLLYVNPYSVFARWLVLQSSDHIVTDPDFRTVKGRADGGLLTDAERAALRQAMLPVLADIAENMAPMLAAGIPLGMQPSATGIDIFLDTDDCVTLLTKVAQGVLSSPEASAALMKLLASHPQLAVLAPQLQQLLPKLPAILEATTRLRLGLSFTIPSGT